MSSRKSVVERYFASMSAVDRPSVLACLADDVEWHIIAAGERLLGKKEFAQNIGTPEGVEGVQIDIARMTEEGNVVVAEGFVRMTKKEGGKITYQFCDVFEFESTRIRRLSTFTAELK